jgi:alpha-glucosidase
VPGEWSKYGSIKHIYSQGRPQLYAYLAEMAAVLKEKKYCKIAALYGYRVLSGNKNPVREYLAFYEGMDPKLPRRLILKAWTALGSRTLGKFLDKFHKALDDFSPLCVASYAFGNHDQHRLATRLGDLQREAPQYCCLSLPGMSFIYNGEEIGMVNGHVPNLWCRIPLLQAAQGVTRSVRQCSGAMDKNAGLAKQNSPGCQSPKTMRSAM